MVDSDTPRYRHAVISYVDLLGFKELIQRSRSEEGLVKQIAETLQSVRNQLSARPRSARARESLAPTEFKAENFSDLTIRCRFVNEENQITQAEAELHFLADMQMWLALDKGVLIRGGICAGQIHFEEGVIFGPGLVKSYVLESQYAIYPRIVVDRDLAFPLMNAREGDPTLPPVVRGEDGAFYLDYLGDSVAFDLFVNEWRDACNILQGHRDFVLNQIGTGIVEKPEKVKQKLVWLGMYHNRAIDRLASHDHFSHHETRITALKLDEESLRF